MADHNNLSYKFNYEVKKIYEKKNYIKQNALNIVTTKTSGSICWIFARNNPNIALSLGEI